MEASSNPKRPYPSTSSNIASSSNPSKSQRLSVGEGEWQEVLPIPLSVYSQLNVWIAGLFQKFSLCSLPEELLIAVIQHLPWRDRVRVERVNKRWRHLALTHGWTGVRHFSNYGHNNIAQMSKLLDRCGRFVDSIHLASIDRLEILELLGKCPRAGRVEVESVGIDSQFVDYLRSRTAGPTRGSQYGPLR